MRLEVIIAYGGKCACCGEGTHEFLALDHTHGGGNEHRRKVLGYVTGGDKFYRWLREQGWPQDDFRLLCHNRNTSRAFYGRCPHEAPCPE